MSVRSCTLVAVVTAMGLASSCKRDAGELETTIRRIAEAESLYAVARAQRLNPSWGVTYSTFVIRQQNGKLAIDNTNGRERLLFGDGGAWIADANTVDVLDHPYSQTFSMLGDLPGLIARMSVAGDHDGRGREALGAAESEDVGRLSLQGAYGAAFGELLVSVENEIPKRISVYDRAGRSRSIVDFGDGAMSFDFDVLYWREDVPLSPGWDAVRNASRPPALRGSGHGDPWSDLDEYPYAAHETFREVWLGPHDSEADVDLRRSEWRAPDLPGRCEQNDILPGTEFATSFAPHTQGNPWRDYLAIPRRGECGLELVGRFYHGFGNKDGVVDSLCSESSATVLVGASTVGVVNDRTCSGTTGLDIEEWVVPLPSGVSIEELTVSWSGRHAARCASISRPTGKGVRSSNALVKSTMEARVRWDCARPEALPLDAKRRFLELMTGTRRAR